MQRARNRLRLSRKFAALRIEKEWLCHLDRGFVQRKLRASRLRKLTEAATKIQRTFRGYAVNRSRSKQYWRQWKLELSWRTQAAICIQSLFRGFVCRQTVPNRLAIWTPHLCPESMIAWEEAQPPDGTLWVRFFAPLSPLESDFVGDPDFRYLELVRAAVHSNRQNASSNSGTSDSAMASSSKEMLMANSLTAVRACIRAAQWAMGNRNSTSSVAMTWLKRAEEIAHRCSLKDPSLHEVHAWALDYLAWGYNCVGAPHAALEALNFGLSLGGTRRPLSTSASSVLHNHRTAAFILIGNEEQVHPLVLSFCRQCNTFQVVKSLSGQHSLSEKSLALADQANGNMTCFQRLELAMAALHNMAIAQMRVRPLFSLAQHTQPKALQQPTKSSFTP